MEILLQCRLREGLSGEADLGTRRKQVILEAIVGLLFSCIVRLERREREATTESLEVHVRIRYSPVLYGQGGRETTSKVSDCKAQSKENGKENRSKERNAIYRAKAKAMSVSICTLVRKNIHSCVRKPEECRMLS